ncbi:MAG: hypothetical protein AB7N70_13295 [Dehalococcoidia bacterium]
MIASGTDNQNAARRERRRLLRWAAGGGAALIGSAAVLGRTREITRAISTTDDQRIEGSWHANFNTVPPTPTPALFRITFTSNGGLIIAYPPLRPQPDGRLLFVTNGAGAWTRTGPQEYSFTYAIDVHETRQEPPLNPRIETHTVWADFTLGEDGERWEGMWKRQNVDLGGNVVGGLDGRVFATRLVVTPMP